MLLLPIILLAATVLLIWILRKRHLRIHWFLASLSMLFAWVATYLLKDRIPISLEFSIWEPQTLFSSPLLFKLDWISWPLLMTAVTILLVISLTLPSRDVLITVKERLTTLIYLGMTMAATLAGNMLSVVTTWMLMDVFILTLGMWGTDHDESGSEIIRWFAKNLISIFLLLIALVLDLSKGGGLNFGDRMLGASMVIVFLAIFLRMPIQSISKFGVKIGWRDSGNLSTLDIFPALSGFSVLGHILTNGISTDAVIWVRLFGGIYLALTLVRSVLWTRTEVNLKVLYIGVLGIGILSASYESIEAGILISSLGVLVSLLNLTLGYLPIHENWHTVVPALFIAMLAGLPGTLGSVLGTSTANEIIRSGAVGIALFVWFGMGILAGTFIKNAVLYPVDWKNSENLTRISYAIGLVFLVLNGVLIGIEMKQDVTLNALILFLSVALIAGLFYYSMTKFGDKVTNGTVRYFGIPRMELGLTGIRQFGHYFFRILSGIGDILESENGMLWAFVILQFIILAIGKLGI